MRTPRQNIYRWKYALALVLIGASLMLIVGTSLEAVWLGQVTAAEDDGWSTVPIPPPNRPTPLAADSTPSKTPTFSSAPATDIPAMVIAPGTGSTPNRPTPLAADSTPSKTPTFSSAPATDIPAMVIAPETGSTSFATLWLGIALGLASLVGLAIGSFILLSSQGRRGGT